MALIELTNIVKTFNEGQEGEITVLHEVDFQVNQGEFLAVVGASGSGKSTLMNIIGLLDRPSSGTYYLNGRNALETNDDKLALLRCQNIGFVFQNFNLIGRMSAAKNVEMPMMYAGVSGRQRQRKAEEFLAKVGMADRLNHRPNELSGGQKQRVAIARALANNPEIILADEPTGALDSTTGRMVMDMFHDLNKNHGKTIVFITHNEELAAESDRTVSMVDGRVGLRR